jgi:acetolactate synthase-1/3 small subunit
MPEEQVKKIVKQIDKQVEVIKAYYHTNEESIFLQSALFKIKSSLLFDMRQIQNIIKKSNSQIVTVNRDFFVIEKSGRKEEIEDLYNELLPYGIMQFVRSGRISVSKDEMRISDILKKQLN